MIIGIDASRANLKERRGTEWYSFYLIKELYRIIGPEHAVILYTREPLLPDLAENMPSHFSCRVLSWKPGFLWTQIRFSIEMLFHKVDMLFVPAHTIPLIHPKNTIVTLHDIGFESHPELYDFKPIGPQKGIIALFVKYFIKVISFGKYTNNELDYHKWAVRFALKHAAHIITVSDFSRKEIISFYKILESKISRVYISYDEHDYHKITDRNVIKKTLQHYTISEPFVLTIGQIEKKKNIVKLIEAWAILKKQYKLPHVLVLGGKPGFGYDEVQGTIAKLGLQNSVLQIGYVNQSDMPILMSAAAVYVFPSLYEGFGIPVLEAFACEVPLICSRAGSLPEIAQDSALYFQPEDADSLAKLLYAGLTDAHNTLGRVQKGKQLVKNFSWHTTALKTWDILQSFV